MVRMGSNYFSYSISLSLSLSKFLPSVVSILVGEWGEENLLLVILPLMLLKWLHCWMHLIACQTCFCRSFGFWNWTAPHQPVGSLSMPSSVWFSCEMFYLFIVALLVLYDTRWPVSIFTSDLLYITQVIFAGSQGTSGNKTLSERTKYLFIPLY